MVRVGIPQGLLYYQYYPMWQSFFEELGAEVVVSASTNQAVLQEGAGRVVADTCLPVKVFSGHVLSLVNRCDYIFVPAVRSVRRRAYNCAKLLGLPDMMRAIVRDTAVILDIDFDINRGNARLYQAIYNLGRRFTWNPARVRQAALAARQAHIKYREAMSRHFITPRQAIEFKDRLDLITPGDTGSARRSIALIGHPYLVHDEHVNRRLVPKLQRAGYRVLTPEMVAPQTLHAATVNLTGREYWTYEGEVVGAGNSYLAGGVAGVIGVMAFGCGPDSVMMDMVRRQAQHLQTTPFMNLVLDEHSGEAGIVTRLEAFLDMIERRNRSAQRLCV